MKPIAVFRFAETEGPGYFATFLDHHSIPWQLFAIDRDAAIPDSASAFSGICLMGGPMSVNDPLPWIDSVCALIRDGDARGIPTIGHCLGGQLISKALGGQITRCHAKEIGWGKARVEPSPTARRWFGNDPEVTVFQWHGETFSLPDGATHLLSNEYCANQAFILRKNLAMQCHVEMTDAMIAEWCHAWPSELASTASLPASVQNPAQMLSEAASHFPAMRRLADRLYALWLQELQP